MIERPSDRSLHLGEALGLGLFGGIVIGLFELWFGLVGEWATGRQWALLGACIASGIAFSLPWAVLNWLVASRSRLIMVLLAIPAGALAGFVFGFVFWNGAISWRLTVLGAIVLPVMYWGERVAGSRRKRDA
jgi:hypothetical protein